MYVRDARPSSLCSGFGVEPGRPAHSFPGRPGVTALPVAFCVRGGGDIPMRAGTGRGKGILRRQVVMYVCTYVISLQTDEKKTPGVEEAE